jgi:hypothetical protein
MPRLDVGHCRRLFERDLLNMKRFLQEAREFRVPAGHAGCRSVGIRTIGTLAGLQLLKLHLAWEEFLESVFLRYLCGCISPSGYCRILLTSREHGITTATSRLFSGYRYLNWGPSEAVDRAERYFQNGEPFSVAIGSAAHELEALTVIRNRFAHRSEHAQSQFRQLVRNELGFNPPGITPGHLLLTTSTIAKAGGQTYFDYYAGLMLGLAFTMVP